jgi:serine/threonine-protein kinase HipA
MDKNGTWRVAPAYDLTFSQGPNGEHCSMVMGEGRQPGIKHLMELAELSNIKKSNALQIIDEVRLSVLRWSSFAKDSGVSAKSSQLVESAIAKVIKGL